MGRLINKVTGKASTAAYASLLKVDLEGAQAVVIWIKEENVNDIKWKVLASNDDETYETIKVEATLAKNGSTYETLTDAWRYIDVQFADNVAATHGQARCFITEAK